MYYDFFDSTFSMFSIMNFILPLFFIAFLGVFIFIAVKAIKQWNYNNHQAVLTVDATIVARRTHVSSDSSFNNNMHNTSTTTYYITFQVESGSRMEFLVPFSEYGVLVEGDHGKLTFQGTRYLGFKRMV